MGPRATPRGFDSCGGHLYAWAVEAITLGWPQLKPVAVAALVALVALLMLGAIAFGVDFTIGGVDQPVLPPQL